MIDEWLLMAGKFVFWFGFVLLLCSPINIPKKMYQNWKSSRIKVEYDEYLMSRGFDFFFLGFQLVILAYLLWWR